MLKKTTRTQITRDFELRIGYQELKAVLKGAGYQFPDDADFSIEDDESTYISHSITYQTPLVVSWTEEEAYTEEIPDDH